MMAIPQGRASQKQPPPEETESRWPQDQEAEKALINLAYNYPPKLLDLIDAGVTENFFLFGNNSYLYGLLCQMLDEDKGIHPTRFAVISRLKAFAKSETDVDSLLNYFMQVVAEPIPVEWFGRYQDSLIVHFKKRELLSLAERLAKLACDKGLPADVPLTFVRNEADRIDWLTKPHRILNGAALETLMRADYADAATRPSGVSWGIDSLDAYTGGTRLGELTLIYAPPGLGKSALLQRAFFHRAFKCLRPQLYIIIGDMTARQVFYRFIQQETGVPALSQARGIFKDPTGFDQWKKVDGYLSQLPGLPLYVCEAEGMESADIRRIAKRLLRETDTLDIYLDHIGHLTDPAEGIYQKTVRIAANLVNLAHYVTDADGNPLVSVTAVSPVNAEGSYAGARDLGHAPENIFRLEPLKPEKGGPDPEKPPDEQSGIMRFVIEKNRYGGKGSVQLWFDAPRVRFLDVSKK